MSTLSRQDYRAIYKDLAEEKKEFTQAGKDRLFEAGVTFSVFKKSLYEMLVIGSDKKVNPYDLFQQLCYEVGNTKPEFLKLQNAVQDFIVAEFSNCEMSTHGVRLKTKPDNRL